MLEQLAERAAAVGIERFVAEVMGDNAAMMRVFEDAGFGVSRALDRGTFEVTFPIEPTDAYRGHVEERDHLAVVASLRPFFAPASVAVIGASTRREAIGGIVFRNILGGEFKGAAYPVNRTGEPVAGVRGVLVDRGAARAGRPRSDLPAGRPRARGCAVRARGGDPRALRDLCGVRGNRTKKDASARSSCSRSCALMAAGSSGPTASASPSPRRR